MDRRAWQAAVQRVAESDTEVTEATSHGTTYESTGLSIFIPQTLK